MTLNIHLNYDQAIPDSSWCIPKKNENIFLQKDLLMFIAAILIAKDWTSLVVQW